MNNLHHFFYKEYFNGVDFGYHLADNQKKSIDILESGVNKISDRNKIILNAQLPDLLENLPVSSKFQSVISYPGLITGVGIAHETGITGEFKLGMHFDYTYGIPVIYGSSVKGLLRNAFPKGKDNQKVRDCKIKQIRDYLGPGFENTDVDALKEQIFDGIKERVTGKNRKETKYFSIYERDIFFDAVIVKPNKKGKILDSDSITPHGDNPLKNPIPITFLKIAPGVTMEFRFDLKNGIIRAEEKLKLFKKILLDFGIGAKTNVGYGQFRL